MEGNNDNVNFSVLFNNCKGNSVFDRATNTLNVFNRLLQECQNKGYTIDQAIKEAISFGEHGLVVTEGKFIDNIRPDVLGIYNTNKRQLSIDKDNIALCKIFFELASIYKDKYAENCNDTELNQIHCPPAAAMLNRGGSLYTFVGSAIGEEKAGPLLLSIEDETAKNYNIAAGNRNTAPVVVEEHKVDIHQVEEEKEELPANSPRNRYSSEGEREPQVGSYPASEEGGNVQVGSYPASEEGGNVQVGSYPASRKSSVASLSDMINDAHIGK